MNKGLSIVIIGQPILDDLEFNLSKKLGHGGRGIIVIGVLTPFSIMSDTELDVSSLGSGDDGALLVFPSDEEGEEEEEDTDEEAEAIRAAGQSPPFLVVPEDDQDR